MNVFIFDWVNVDLYATFYSVTDKAAAFLMAMPAYGETGTRDGGPAAMRQLDGKCNRVCHRVTNETTLALQGAFSKDINGV